MLNEARVAEFAQSKNKIQFTRKSIVTRREVFYGGKAPFDRSQNLLRILHTVMHKLDNSAKMQYPLLYLSPHVCPPMILVLFVDRVIVSANRKDRLRALIWLRPH